MQNWLQIVDRYKAKNQKDLDDYLDSIDFRKLVHQQKKLKGLLDELYEEGDGEFVPNLVYFLGGIIAGFFLVVSYFIMVS